MHTLVLTAAAAAFGWLVVDRFLKTLGALGDALQGDRA